MDNAPNNMVEVSKEIFFSTVGQLDVNPRSEPNCTFWELRNRKLVGWDSTGWKNCMEITRWYVLPEFVPDLTNDK